MKDDTDLVSSLLAHDEDVPLPAAHEQRIREGLASMLSVGAVPAGPRDLPSPRAGDVTSTALRKWMTTGMVVIAAGGAGFVAGRATAPQAKPQVVVRAAPAIPTTEPAPVASIASGAPPSISASVAVAVPSAKPTLPPPGVEDAFNREQSLLERARSALVRHDADGAQGALDEYDRKFPRSRHAEERDYLRIQVLRERGDGAGARERAKAFLAKYPESMLRARVAPLAE